MDRVGDRVLQPLFHTPYPKNICVTFYLEPRAGSGVVRMDPLRFLAGCRTKPGLVSVLYLSMFFIVLVFIRAPFMYC